MSETPVEPVQTSSSAEQQPTPLELANGWLDFRNLEVNRKIGQTQRSINFNTTYEPKAPIRPSYIERGSTDASDWNVAEHEYNQWEHDRDDELERLNDKVDSLYDELSTIDGYRQQVAEGDASSIQTFSEKEATRRAKIAEEERKTTEKKRLQEERAAGKEMDGVTEVESQLRQVTNTVRDKRVETYQKGQNGWQVGWHNLKDKYNSRDLFDYDKDGHKVQVRVYSDEGDGFSVQIDDFRNPEQPEKPTKYPTDYGDSMWFTIKEDKVYHWGKGKMERSYQWGYPDYRRLHSDQPFEQADFDRAHNLLNELTTDIASLSQKTS